MASHDRRDAEETGQSFSVHVAEVLEAPNTLASQGSSNPEIVLLLFTYTLPQVPFFKFHSRVFSPFGRAIFNPSPTQHTQPIKLQGVYKTVFFMRLLLSHSVPKSQPYLHSLVVSETIIETWVQKYLTL